MVKNIGILDNHTSYSRLKSRKHKDKQTGYNESIQMKIPQFWNKSSVGSMCKLKYFDGNHT